MGKIKKVSESYEKAGECVSELPCEHEFHTRVAFRSKEVSDTLAQMVEDYSKLSDEEIETFTENLEAYMECNETEIEKEKNRKKYEKKYKKKYKGLSSKETVVAPACYLENMTQQNICLLNKIQLMDKGEQVLHALKMIKKRFFIADGLEADWARLFTLWFFEYGADTKNDDACFFQAKAVTTFLNYKEIPNVPNFSPLCNTFDLGHWTKYEGQRFKNNPPMLVFRKNDAYIRDIMTRDPYKYAVRELTKAIKKIPKELRSKNVLENLIKEKSKLGIANFSYIGPMTGTEVYTILESFLGTYKTDIEFVSYNEERREVKIKVTTENMSHWQSATRLPGSITQKKYFEFMGNPEYDWIPEFIRQYADAKPLENTTWFYDNKERGEVGDLELIDMAVWMLPSQATASTLGAYKNYKLSKGDVQETLKGLFEFSSRTIDMYKLGNIGHNFFGGSFVQRFEGEDVIKIDDLWLRESTVYFDFDKSSLDGFRRDQALSILKSLVQEAKSRRCKLKVTIKGFADATGLESYNKGLSQKRADTILNYLGSKLEIQEASSLGYGESKEHLLVPSMPESALNRRVEILIEEIV
jgi:outer membrane protein OmpA-like peptidoglycan-associated protein